MCSKKTGPNGRDLRKTPLDRRLLPCTETTLTDAVNKNDTFWVEALHGDGGMSILHFGLGLGGRWDLVCRQEGSGPQFCRKNEPGTVYLGQLTAHAIRCSTVPVAHPS